MKNIKIAWFGKHFGEEPPFIGKNNEGAGGVFFSGCNLRCVFCQNFQISHNSMGKFYSINELSEIFLQLQNQNVKIIDLVTPTIWYKQIIEALSMAKNNGLHIPVAWNSNAYEDIYMIEKINDFVDIYMPDFKYSDDQIAFKYSNATNYSEIAQKAIQFMHKQKGSLKFDKKGDVISGMIVRHLILPGHLQNTKNCLDFIAKISPDIHLSLMRQYYPLNVEKFPEIDRKISDDEYLTAIKIARDFGIKNLYIQSKNCENFLIPDFTKEKPF